jgi:VWFA-related protein
MKALLVSLLILSLNVTLAAQTPTQNPPPTKPVEDEVVRVTTNLVQVDAVVMDKNGKPITDLRADDFEILEDNRPQQVSAFSYISSERSRAESTASEPPPMAVKNAPPLPPAPPKPGEVQRTIVFVIDDLALSLQSFNAVRAGLKKFIDEQMQPGDLAAIVRTGGGAGALQRFTTDKRQLYAAVETARWRISFGNRAGLRTFAENVISLPRAEADERGRSQIGTIMSLENIVRSLKPMPGRKSVIFFSDQFDVLPKPGDLKIGAATTPKPGDSTTPTTDERDPMTGYPAMIGDLVQAAAQSSVVIYTVDARGLVYTGPTATDNSPTGNLITGDPGAQLVTGSWLTGMLDQRSAAVLATQQSLQELAHQTGGIAIVNNNDIGKGLGRIMDELKGYYLIGYRPSETTFARNNGRIPYHRITLKLKRPGLYIRSRSGFYGVTDDGQRKIAARSKAEQLAIALESPFAAGDVRVRLTTLFGNVPQMSFVRMLFHIDARDLSFTDQADGWHEADFDVLASSYGENGLIADYLSRSEKVRARGKSYANLLRHGLNYNLLIPIKKPGPYQLRAAIRDAASDRIGSAYQFVEVPDLKQGHLAVSGIAIRSVVLDLEALSSDSAVYNAALQAGDQAQPTPAVRRFKAGTLMDYGYFIYNAAPGPKGSLPDLHAEVRLFHDGELVTSQEDSAIDSSRLQLDLKRLSARGSLRLSDQMVPGQYVLQIVITDPRAKEKFATATQWIDFDVVK